MSNVREKELIVCDNCGVKAAHIRRVAKSYGKGAELLVIEDVPVVSCTHCGESYLTADVLHELEKIKAHRREVAVERQVEVATFSL